MNTSRVKDQRRGIHGEGSTDKNGHFNRLSAAEDERLAVLAEECAEVIQAITKIQRHGYDSRDPTSRAEYPPDNRQMLAAEIGDVMAAVEMLIDWRDVYRPDIVQATDAKRRKVQKYLHHHPALAGKDPA